MPRAMMYKNCIAAPLRNRPDASLSCVVILSKRPLRSEVEAFCGRLSPLPKSRAIAEGARAARNVAFQSDVLIARLARILKQRM